jgi:radical SAM superfamily enzyme YgiQ (UPF0313 family)
MNVVLFHPRGYNNSIASRRIAGLAVTLPPLGLASIAAVLRASGHTVSIIDACLKPRITNRQWAREIVSRRPDIVGFSAITPSFLDAYDVCCKVKQLRDTIQTVFGGVHVSWGEEQILRRFPAVDCVISGEGEYSFLKLAEQAPRETIEALIYRDGDTIRCGPRQQSLCRMDDLPFPAYDALDGFPRSYALPLFNYRRHPGASVISSRGCIYQCSYCDRSVFRKSFRWNSPEYTCELVKWLCTDFGVRHVIFYDDLFTLNRNRVSRLCTLFRKARLGVAFNCIVRIGHIDKELIEELKSAGCWMVNVGIESGSQHILDSHKEGLRLEEIRRDINALHAAGLWVKGLFMMGFPGETEQSIQATIEFACSLPLKDANVTAFTPFPGAPVYKGIETLGTLEDDWPLMDCVNFVFVPNEIPDKETLERYYRIFLNKFYNRPFSRKAYRAMLLQSPHSYWRLIKHAGTFLTYARKLRRKA